jgi:DNA-binding NarL/FixJ family response regulator
MNRITVLIADEHEMARCGMKQWLESELDISVVAETSVAADVLQLALARKPQVLLLALHLPDKNGYDVIHEIRAAGASLPILVMGHSEDRSRAVIEAGANGFLFKREGRDQFVSAIRWAASGKHGVWISKAEAAIQQQVDRAIATANLTRTDLNILRLLHLTNSEISAKLSLSVGTVKNHVTGLYSKLGVNTRIEAFSWGHSKGIL